MYMEGERKSTNCGFSLIELIVAVLIMAIMVTAAVMSFSSVNNARAERAATVSASVLKRARQKALAMDSDTTLYAEFKLDSGTYYGTVCFGTEEIVREKLGNDRLTLKFCNHNGTGTSATVSDSVKVRVYFKKSTGGIDHIESTGTGGVHLLSMVDKLEITGSGDGENVILGKTTGRCYIEE